MRFLTLNSYGTTDQLDSQRGLPVDKLSFESLIDVHEFRRVSSSNFYVEPNCGKVLRIEPLAHQSYIEKIYRVG